MTMSVESAAVNVVQVSEICGPLAKPKGFMDQFRQRPAHQYLIATRIIDRSEETRMEV
jgi:hypothetical protein